MIFIAVTMGFIAENIREHISEKSKAGEYAASLYKEMYADSTSMAKKLALRATKENQIQYFRSYVSDSSLEHVTDELYYSFAWSFVMTTSVIFEPNGGVLNELKSSGSLRYFKDIALQRMISDISVSIAKLRSRNAQEYSFVEDITRPFTIRHFDFKWQDAFTSNGKLSIVEAAARQNFHAGFVPVIQNLADFKKDHAASVAAYYLLIISATRQVYYQDYKEKNHQLLQALRTSYRFE